MSIINKILFAIARRKAKRWIRQFEARNTGLEGVDVENITRSPRTTAWAVVSILGAACAIAVALLDGNPATNPDWALVGTTLIPCLRLFVAKD
jgi:hypothetical protein